MRTQFVVLFLSQPESLKSSGPIERAFIFGGPGSPIPLVTDTCARCVKNGQQPPGCPCASAPSDRIWASPAHTIRARVYPVTRASGPLVQVPSCSPRCLFHLRRLPTGRASTLIPKGCAFGVYGQWRIQVLRDIRSVAHSTSL